MEIKQKRINEYGVFYPIPGNASAHRGCMAADGGTIAVVAIGLNLLHPRENIPLQKEILRKGGLILSGQSLGVKASPTRLAARNRLQAALASSLQ